MPQGHNMKGGLGNLIKYNTFCGYSYGGMEKKHKLHLEYMNLLGNTSFSGNRVV
jgi:hypothetical protein